jgi:uncharacterized membrane protein YccC
MTLSWELPKDKYRKHRGTLRHALRVSVAAGVTFALIRLFNFPGGQWAVFTSIIVVQTSIGGTIAQALERFIGTIVGAAAGAAAVYIQDATKADPVFVLVLLVALCAFAAGGRPALRAAPLTAVIMLVSRPLDLDPATAAFFRTGEILLGGLVGVAATLVIFPAHAHAAVASKLRAVLSQFEAILALHIAALTSGGGDEAAQDLYTQARTGLGEMQTAMGEAARESASRLGDESHTQATSRTAWRVRTDLVNLGRTLNEAMHVKGLIEPASAVLAGYAAFIAACRASMTGGPRPDRMTLATAHADFQAAVQALRDSGAMRGIPYDDLAQAFGFVFAIDARYANLNDLSDRLQEDLEAQKS